MRQHVLAKSIVTTSVFLIALAIYGRHDLLASNGPPARAADHCLIYGKYCLGNSLRGR
jgi:hypothetical protein